MKLRRAGSGRDADSSKSDSSKSGAGKSGAGKSDSGKDKRELVTPGNAKKAIAVGKILAPVLVPIVMQFAGMARGAWDERRARRLGVSASELNSFSGKGGALHARIARVSMSISELSATQLDSHRAAEVDRFTRANGPKLADLSAAVRGAELMPTERRRAAHRAVAGELDQIEPQLLALLGVNSRNGSSAGVE